MPRTIDPILGTLREMALRMGSLSEAILGKALRAVWERDAALAREVKIDDLEIDRLDLAIDESVLRALALQAPLADDLRKVIAIKMMASDLERVGDLSRNIAKSGERLVARKKELGFSDRRLAQLTGKTEDEVEDSDIVLRYISEGWEKLYGGKLEFIADPDEMIRSTLEHIDKKRAALGLPAYDANRFGKSGDARMLELEELPLEQRVAALYGVAAD